MTDTLTPGHEMEDAMRFVDPRELIPLLDFIRNDTNTCRNFATEVAKVDPQFFMKVAKILGGAIVNMSFVDECIKKHDPIPAIKHIRTVANLGLKEAKQTYDQRKASLGF